MSGRRARQWKQRKKRLVDRTQHVKFDVKTTDLADFNERITKLSESLSKQLSETFLNAGKAASEFSKAMTPLATGALKVSLSDEYPGDFELGELTMASDVESSDVGVNVNFSDYFSGASWVDSAPAQDWTVEWSRSTSPCILLEDASARTFVIEAPDRHASEVFVGGTVFVRTEETRRHDHRWLRVYRERQAPEPELRADGGRGIKL